MPHPVQDPIAFCMAAALSPDDPTLEASRESVQALDTEIRRMELRIDRLKQAKANIQKRMKAA